MKAVLGIETIVTITLDLEGSEFSLPQHRQGQVYKVLSVAWLVKSTNTHSHPITAKAIDSDNVEWSLSLRWSDLPTYVQDELIKAVRPEDVPAEGIIGIGPVEKGQEIQAAFNDKFPNT